MTAASIVKYARTVSKYRLDLRSISLSQLNDGTCCKGGEHGAGQLEAVEAIGRRGA